MTVWCERTRRTPSARRSNSCGPTDINATSAEVALIFNSKFHCTIKKFGRISSNAAELIGCAPWDSNPEPID